jgi:hypothetical protein
VENRWQRIALSKEDSSFITKDWVNYISFPVLKNIIEEKNIQPSSLNVALDDSTYEDHWFYAGTLSPFGEWLNNYTTIQSEKDIAGYVSDSSKSFQATALLYVRQRPPGNYSADKGSQDYKGYVSQSLENKDKIYIRDSLLLRDMKGNSSLWLKIRRVEKATGG